MTFKLNNDQYVKSIDVAGIDSAMRFDAAANVVTIDDSAISLEEAERVLRRATRKDTTVPGANIFPRMKSNDEAVRNKSVRPLGSTPVRGTGFKLFGPAPRLDYKKATYKAEEVKFAKRCEERNAKIADWNLKTSQEYLAYIESQAQTVEDRLLLEVERHQSLTGGAYDNCTIAGFVGSVKNFLYKGLHAPALEPPTWQLINLAIDDLIADFDEEGVEWGTLVPTPFHKVRVFQDENSNDGTMGFPVYDHAMNPASQGLAKLFQNVYGVDLSEMLTGDVDDGDGYVGPCRICDMVQELLRNLDLRISDSNMFFTNFTRVQRHGYKHLEPGNVEPKPGKQRAIWIPDAVWGSIHACVYDAVMQHMKAKQCVELTSLMKPDDRVRCMVDQMKRTLQRGGIILSIDESNFDATLIAALMYLIHMRIVAKMFRPEYQDIVKAAGVVFCFKILSIAERTWQEGTPDADQTNPEIERIVTARSRVVGQWRLVKLINGLGSGLKGTMMMGSLYNLVAQYSIAHYQGTERMPHRGMGAGDDAFASVFYDWECTEDTTMEQAYEIVEEWYSKIGLVVNASKQLWIPGLCPPDEHGRQSVFPVGQFLQTTVHPSFSTQGVGSPIRSLLSCPVCESHPYHLNMPEQVIAMMSVMNNGANCKFNTKACELLLGSDPKLLNLFQTLGVEAWDELIREMKVPEDVRDARSHLRDVLGLESKGTGSDVLSAEEQASAMKSGVIAQMAAAASSMSPSTEVWDGSEYGSVVSDETRTTEELSLYDGDEADTDDDIGDDE